MKHAPCALYVRGRRVPCVRVGCDPTGDLAGRAARAAAEAGAFLAMARLDGPAPDGWVPIARGFAKPRFAPPEALTPLNPAHHAAMRGLYGLFTGRFGGMLARENPAEWTKRLERLKNAQGLWDGERLLLWLDADGGTLLELSCAPDAEARIPGALTAAGVVRAPAPLLGFPAEWVDDTLKLRLIKPFLLPDGRIETAEQLARALVGAVQWDE